MSTMIIELNSEGVRELLRSGEMKALLEERANKVADALGEGYEVTTHTGRNRANASIKATDMEALNDQLHNNTILKALKGGGA